MQRVLLCLALLALAPSAYAVECAEGVRGAACAGPHGAAAVRRPVEPYHPPAAYHPPVAGAAVVHPATPAMACERGALGREHCETR